MPSKFSVVIPLYNHSKYIESALDSILKQEYPASEIIIVDDGSTDGGFEIASKFLHGNSSARLFKQDNQGAHVAINKAIAFSSFENIAILNSDDEFTKNKLLRCNEIFSKQSSIDLIFGDINFIDSSGAFSESVVTHEWFNRSKDFYQERSFLPISLMNENFATTTSNFVFKKSLWSNIGGFAELRYCHDYEFLLKSFLFGNVFYDRAVKHINYRTHDANTISESIKKIQKEISAVIAASIIENNSSLYDDQIGKSSYEVFSTMLVNKNLSSQILYFATIYMKYRNRYDFYKFISSLDSEDFF
jgi:glycosyltransferase involved in cell wall biosynthesis